MSKLIKIESISTAKRKDYYKIETSIGPFLISEGMIVKYHILKDNEFLEEEFNEIMAEITKEKYFSSALNYISYQMRSEKEIREYLTNKDIPFEILDATVSRLKELDYINDDELAKAYLVESKNKGKGPLALKNKYLLKGIDREIYNKYLEEYNSEVELEIAVEKGMTLVLKYSEYPINKQKQKIYEKLVRDGFSQSISNKVLNLLEYKDDSDEKLKKEIRKQLLKIEILNYENKKKLISKLLLKGYEYKKIKEYIEEVSEEENHE